MSSDGSPAPVREVRRATNAEWDATWRSAPGATYFQSREWAETWSRHAPGGERPHPLHVTLADGATAVLPLSRRPGARCAPTWLLSPAGTFGGWLSREALGVPQARALTGLLLGLQGHLRWRVNPYDPLLARLRVTGAQDDETHVLDLSDGFEAVAAGFRRGQRSSIRKAERSGLVVAQAHTREDWNGFVDAYEDSLRRWGATATSRYPRALFLDMQQAASPSVRLWVATFEGRVVAGALCFHTAEHVVYWAGAAHSSAFHLRPMNLVMRDAISDAADRGHRWFDFNPSGGHEGVREFKRSFGAQPLRAPMIVTTTRGARLAEAGARLLERGRR